MNCPISLAASRPRSALGLGLVVALVWASPYRPALASVEDLQDAAQDHPDLTHQYTFDGADFFERRQDSRGIDDLVEQAGGSATVDDIVYGVAGFDDTSEAVTTFRPPPGGTEFSDGANFRIPSIALGDAFSYEVIFRPGREVIEGGDFNLGYILANRIGNDRGYFLYQGSAEQDEFGAFGYDGDDLASVVGSSFNVSNENTILETIEVGHWYYVAGSYRHEDGNTTFTSYIADLTDGQDTLTVVGPITVPGSYGRDFAGLSIGGRFDGPGEGFPGDIDEVNLYGDEVDEEVFEEHLSALLGEVEPRVLFHRGDPNDSGVLDLSDGTFIFNHLFTGGPPPACAESADGNGDGAVDLSDGVYLLNFLFLGGDPPVAPGPPDESCGELPSDSQLGCESYSSC